ncbi:hypothetical protein CL619_03545 [archaeon]|nr:hypothetical protein [archaeon]
MNIFDSVSGDEKSDLTMLHGVAHGKFESADTSLMFETDTTVTYGSEIAIVASGTEDSEQAAAILETLMDPEIVATENEAYAELSKWKWLTVGLGVFGGLFGFNLARRSRERYSYNRHY